MGGRNMAAMFGMDLNDVGLAGLGGHFHAALSAAAGRYFKREVLLCWSKQALGGDLLRILPEEDSTDERQRDPTRTSATKLS